MSSLCRFVQAGPRRQNIGTCLEECGEGTMVECDGGCNGNGICFP